MWIFNPLIGPMYIKGLRRTPEENISFINNQNIVLLSDPNIIIKDKKSDYYDWAYSEFRVRAIVSSLIWIVMVALFGVWIYKNKKSITST